MLRPVTVSGGDCKSLVLGLLCSNRRASTKFMQYWRGRGHVLRILDSRSGSIPLAAPSFVVRKIKGAWASVESRSTPDTAPATN